MVISGSVRPPMPFYASDLERGLDPWRQDAFPDEFKFAGTKGSRREGWFYLDSWGNAVGFVPDGTRINP